MIISERIFYLLKQKGMTQSEFAKKVGIANSTISDWKRKKTNPLSEYILPICEALEVSPEQLLSGRGIDPDYKEKVTNADMDFIVSKADISLLKEIHKLQDGQMQRLLAYLKVLRQLEELEDFRTAPQK